MILDVLLDLHWRIYHTFHISVKSFAMKKTFEESPIWVFILDMFLLLMSSFGDNKRFKRALCWFRGPHQ